jgi:hypothetical protein
VSPTLALTARAVLRSLVPVVCPPEASTLANAISEHVLLGIDSMPSALRHGFFAGLVTYDLGALPRHRKRARALTGAAAEAYFASWERSRMPLFAELAHTLNRVLSLSCYEQPEMAAAIGFHPAAWIDRARTRRLAVYSDDIRKQAEQILAADPLRPSVLGPRPSAGTETETPSGRGPRTEDRGPISSHEVA